MKRFSDKFTNIHLTDLMKKSIISAVLLSATLGAGAVTPLWLRDVRISPDGKTIAFTYKGDISPPYNPTNQNQSGRLTAR